MDFDALLDLCKDSFEPYRALIVLDDKALRRYVMSWGAPLVRRVSDWPEGDTMADLWRCVRVDYQALADLSGDSMPQVMSYFTRAQGLQLIYPDGTVPQALVKLLRKKLSEISGV